jgi:hypothetical protein
MSAKWHKGPPPSVGWWPASISRDGSMLRWWNGEIWSIAVAAHRSSEYAAKIASMPEPYYDIEWKDRPKSWPERSRT